jgi:RNA polymerase sigma-70 factor (ECF subfamily)
MEECQAIALLKSGNVNGLEPLVHRYYFQAVRASYLIVQDLKQAEDIVQTSFLHASDKIDQLSSDRFGPWFMKMVVNASIKVVQKQKRLVSLEDQEEGSKFLAEWLIDPHPSVESMVETEELRQGVWKALTQLNARQRAAIVLKYYLEMSEEEMSQTLHIPVSTIKWLLYAARRKLQDLLKFLKNSSNPVESETIHSLPKQQEKECENERQKF